MNITRALAQFAAAATYDALPPEVVAKTRLVVMDTLGCGLAGYTIAREELAPLIRLAHGEGGSGTCTVLCDGQRTTAALAAFANGGIIHTIDFDDTSSTCFAHFGATLVPAAFALAQHTRAGGQAVIAAVAVGYDVANRVGRTVWPSHYDRWHPTSTLGTIGAAVAAAKLLGLDADAMERAIGLAADAAAGLRYCIDHGDFSKLLHPALAAMKGVMAARLAEAGAAGPRGLLEDKSGFCNAFAVDPNPAAALDGLGERFEIALDIIKAYPTINCSQAPIQAMLDMVAGNDLAPADIEHIHLTRMLRPSSKDQGINYAPQTVLAARLSIPFCLSLAAHCRAVTLDEFTTERLRDPAIVALMHKVEIVMDETLNRDYPGGTAAMILRVTLKDGRTLERFVRYPKGNPNDPLSDDEVRVKFGALASRTLPAERVERLAALLARLETLPDVDALMEATRAG